MALLKRVALSKLSPGMRVKGMSCDFIVTANPGLQYPDAADMVATDGSRWATDSERPDMDRRVYRCGSSSPHYRPGASGGSLIVIGDEPPHPLPDWLPSVKAYQGKYASQSQRGESWADHARRR